MITHIKTKEKSPIKNFGFYLFLNLLFYLGSTTSVYAQLEIKGPANVNAGSSVDYFTTDCPGMSYTWHVEGGPIVSGIGTSKIRVNWGCKQGYGFIRVEGAGGVGPPPCDPFPNGELLVTINYLNEAPLVIKGSTVVCEGNEYTYEVPNYTLVTDYQWTVPTGAVIISTSSTKNSITVKFAKKSGSIEVIPQNSVNHCPNAKASLSVEVKAIPQGGGAISGKTDPEPGATGITYSVVPDPMADSYEWTLSPGATFTPGYSEIYHTISVDFSLSALPGDIKVRPVTLCGKGKISTLKIIPFREPDPPGPIIGPTSVCANAKHITYHIDPVNNATAYKWKITGGSPAFMSLGNYISVNWGTAGEGHISVEPMNKKGSGGISQLTVSILKSGVTKINKVVYDNASLKAAQKQKLTLSSCTSASPCVTQKIAKAELNVLFNTGEDYEYGKNKFETQVEVRLTPHALPLPNITLQVEKYKTTLTINETTPEQLYQVDFTDDYSGIDYFDVEILKYEENPIVSSDIKLTIFYTEKDSIDVRSVQPLLSVKPAIKATAGSNRYTFSWKSTCPEIFPNYEFQLLRLYNNDNTKSLSSGLSITAEVDWSRALTIETQSSETSITLSIVEGTGYYIWRVRPIGNWFEGGIANNNNWGVWSEAPPNHSTVTELDLNNKNYAFFYIQFDKNLNWIYNRTFAEGNTDPDCPEQQVRIDEAISYANGLEQIRQTQTHLESEDKVLVSQALQDFSGRNALTSMAVPIKGKTSLGYQSLFMKNAAGKLYSADDFDKNSNYKEPGRVSDAAGDHFDYYSNNNPDVNIPNAEGYPFTRKLFYSDGTDRVREESGVGETHRIKKNDSKTKKTFYSNVPKDELIRVFGDEAPDDKSVYKIIEMDANNTATVRYISKEGQTIATCLAFTGDNPLLDALDSRKTFKTKDIITGKSTPWGQYGNESSRQLPLFVPTDVKLFYELTANSIKDLCHNYCATCDYVVEITVQNEDTTLFPTFRKKIELPPDLCVNPKTFSWDTTLLQLPEGNYTITRRIRANNTNPSQSVAYLQAHLDSLDTLYSALINKTLLEVGVYDYLDVQKVDDLYAHLGINTNVSNPDEVFQDSVVSISFGCGKIDIPIIPCKQNTCPDKYFKPNPNFELYFIEKWIDKHYWLFIVPWFPYINLEYYLPGYFYGQFNEMINNMLTDPYTPYSCDTLWTCWKSLVDNYVTLKYGLSDSVKNSKNKAKPEGMKYNFNLVEAFLNCVGKRIRATSTTPFTQDFDKPGYLSHAYACFKYIPDEKSKNCENTNLSMKKGIIKKYADLGPNDHEEWKNFYDCVKSYENFKYDNNINNKNNLEKPDVQDKKVTTLCESTCEARRKSFEAAVISLYHNLGKYIIKYENGKWVGVDKYKLVYNPATQDLVPGNQSLPDGFFNNYNSLNHIKQSEIDCIVEGLVDSCKSACKLTEIYDPAIPGRIVKYGTDKEIEDIKRAMTWNFIIEKYSSGCEESFQVVSGTSILDGCSICFKWKKPDTLKGHEFKPKECGEINAEIIRDNINEQIRKFIDKKKEAFKQQYYQNCANPQNIKDKFWIEYEQGLYHYTLYYYDRAGNLIKTVPPEGVDLSAKTRNDIPNHSFITDYQYNSLQQLVRQHTPDGGETHFYYDLKGRLRFSQNAQQQEDGVYSYSKYDYLGRVIEVGESNEAIAIAFSDSKYANDQSFPPKGTQKTITVYSDTTSPAVKFLDGRKQRFLLNRVSYTFTDEDGDISTTKDQVTTYFSYDPHGNVEWLIQDLPGLGKNYIATEYDLVSGKVLRIKYNEGLEDQFFHRYQYDADNRLVLVETSTDGKIWDKDAAYTYYAHGPLKRMEIGEDKLQGIDYVYTIQGWLKGINHASLDKNKDPGKDNNSTSRFAPDAFGSNLGYYEGDFKRTNSPFSNTESTTLSPIKDHSLYNGNISTWAAQTKIPSTVTNFLYPGLTGQQFRYDELNRLKKSTFKNYSNGWNPETDYLSKYDYDANGNITSLTRTAHGASPLMDDLSYNYQKGTNLLTHVNDKNVPPGNYSTDIDDQEKNNYQYDKIGNLTKDQAEDIETITWDVYGKVKEVIRPANSNKPNLQFTYGAAGHRVVKAVIYPNAPTQNNTTYYVRDPNGQVMAIYNKSANSTSYTLEEQPIYAGERIGILQPVLEFKPGDQKVHSDLYTRTVGLKNYELKDHLDDVRAVISDVKLSALDQSNNPVVSSFAADLKSVNDYYPFGMLMPERTYQSPLLGGVGSKSYRYGFNGLEQDPEVKGAGNSYTTQFRQYDPRLGRWLSLDPEMKKYSGLSPFNAYLNDPVNLIDPKGQDPKLEESSISVWDFILGLVNFGGPHYFEHKKLSDIAFKSAKYQRKMFDLLLQRLKTSGGGDILDVKLQEIYRDLIREHTDKYFKYSQEAIKHQNLFLKNVLKSTFFKGGLSFGFSLLGSHLENTGSPGWGMWSHGASLGITLYSIKGLAAVDVGLLGTNVIGMLGTGSLLPLAASALAGVAIGGAMDKKFQISENASDFYFELFHPKSRLNVTIIDKRKGYKEEHFPYPGLVVLPNRSYNDIRQFFTKSPHSMSTLQPIYNSIVANQSMSYSDVREAFK